MLNTKFLFAIAILWTTLVATLSIVSIGGIGESVPIPYKDKYVHFTFYFVFVSLWYLYFNKLNPNKNSKWKIVIAAILFGILMEFCQGAFTTTRSPDVYDAISNSVGAILGMLFITTIVKNKPNNKISH